MTSVNHEDGPELSPRARSDIQRLEFEEQFLLDLGEPAAAAKIAAMRAAITAAWTAHARAEAIRTAPRPRLKQVISRRQIPAPNSEATALAPVYAAIREIADRLRREAQEP